MLLLLSHISRIRLCATPQTAAHQAPPPLGFSRQEHWSGLPFPWKWKVKVKSLSRVWPSATPWIAAFKAPPSMGFSRQEYWSGLPCLPPGIFPSQGSNPGLPHCRQILYCLSHQGNPRILECVAYPFFRGTCRPRNWTRVFCIAGGFFTSLAIIKRKIKCHVISEKNYVASQLKHELEAKHTGIKSPIY